MSVIFEHARLPTVWMDVTTSWRNRGSMNGTLRAEESYGAALAEVIPDHLRLCRYHSARRQFVAVEALPEVDTNRADQSGKGDGAEGDGKFRLGRKLERGIRQWRRSLATDIFRFTHRGGGIGVFSQAREGDVLLLAGETWSRYGDFSVLRGVRARSGMRIAAICQDLIPVKWPQFFEADGFVERFGRYTDFLIKDVDLVIAISEQTKKDILDLARTHGGLRGDIATVELGHDAGAAAGDSGSPGVAGIEPGKFVLSVSTIQSRKNFDLLYHLWRRLSEEGLPNLPKLVIVGREGFGSRDLLWQIKHDPAVRDCVIVRHVVPDGTLARLYRDCAWTLYPSFYEGWGLPVSESLAHGKYCVASSAAALQEAGQGLVKHIDPLDFSAWRDAIIELVRSPELVLQFERRIRAQYRPVTWRQSAERLAALLRRPYSPRS